MKYGMINKMKQMMNMMNKKKNKKNKKIKNDNKRRGSYKNTTTKQQQNNNNNKNNKQKQLAKHNNQTTTASLTKHCFSHLLGGASLTPQTPVFVRNHEHNSKMHQTQRPSKQLSFFVSCPLSNIVF